MSVMMHDFEEMQYRVSRSYLSMDKDVGGWREGLFHHPEGLVRVFESKVAGLPVTAMFFVSNGMSYQRRWEGLFGDKTLARLARELVESACQYT